jgi:histidinol dehydrogenase
LIIACQDCEQLATQISNAGSIFLGNYSPESVGDYASGTNHTLPTNGYAKMYSGVSLDSFVKKITLQQLSPQGLKNIGNAVEIMAENEQLVAHKNAVTIRLQNIDTVIKYENGIQKENNSFNLTNLVRKNIQKLQAYSSARDEFKLAEQNTGEQTKEFIFLDANENSFGSAIGNYNRYPDPLQKSVKREIAKWRRVKEEQIFLGNGSDEAIDLLFRIFCEPKKDNVIILPPTYGMYEVSANINDVALRKVALTPDYQIDTDKILATIDQNTKLIFVCSPNNPTANSITKHSIAILLKNFHGIVVVDEAYIDFANTESYLQDLEKYPNLVVLQTFSKAFGLAALRLGMAFASENIMHYFNRIKPPYNVNAETQNLVLQALSHKNKIENWVQIIKEERNILAQKLANLPIVQKVYPSDANFLLVKIANADQVYAYLIRKQVVVRNRSKVELCENCLRITIGTTEENAKLIEILAKFS